MGRKIISCYFRGRKRKNWVKFLFSHFFVVPQKVFKTFWGTTIKCENENLTVFISIWLSEIHGTGRVKIEKLKKSKRSKLEKNITVVCNNYEEQHSGSLVYFSLRKLNSFKEYEVYIIIF